MLDVVINPAPDGAGFWRNIRNGLSGNPTGNLEPPAHGTWFWEDLVELDQRHADLWKFLAEAFLTWCRRGVDGFRCDAGYKIPAHVCSTSPRGLRTEFPDTVFLLEGWAVRETTGAARRWRHAMGLQRTVPGITEPRRWAATSTTVSGIGVRGERSSITARRMTSTRLAALGPQEVPPIPPAAWSRLRIRLCCARERGGLRFTCGVEWAATERVNARRPGPAWGSEPEFGWGTGAVEPIAQRPPPAFDGARLAGR